jgi:hypothetical protein
LVIVVRIIKPIKDKNTHIGPTPSLSNGFCTPNGFHLLSADTLWGGGLRNLLRMIVFLPQP